VLHYKCKAIKILNALLRNNHPAYSIFSKSHSITNQNASLGIVDYLHDSFNAKIIILKLV